MNFLSVCSGIEAASVAWNPLGWHACMVSEIEPFPISVLRHRHGAHDLRRARPAGPHLPLWGDFTALRVRHFRRLGIPLPAWLVGGTPCQAFSVAGKRGSLDDARGNLSLAFIRLAHALASTGALRGLLWENVPGVLSTRDNAFGCFLGELVGGGLPLSPPRGGSWPRAGMVSGPRARAAWRVFDAQYFGLAQRRERVFVVGSFGDGPDPAEVLFERESLHGHSAPRRGQGEKLAESAAYGIDRDCLDRDGEARSGTAADRSGLGIEAGIAQTIRAKGPGAVAYGGNRLSGPLDVATAVNAHGGPHGRQDFESETFVVAHTLRAEGHDASEDGTGRGVPLVPVAFHARQDSSTASDASPPLDTDAGTVGVFSMSGVRRLIPRECERLQGFPDDYTLVPHRGKPAADGPRYKALGNSKAVPVVRWIGARIDLALAGDAA